MGSQAAASVAGTGCHPLLPWPCSQQGSGEIGKWGMGPQKGSPSPHPALFAALRRLSPVSWFPFIQKVGGGFPQPAGLGVGGVIWAPNSGCRGSLRLQGSKPSLFWHTTTQQASTGIPFSLTRNPGSEKSRSQPRTTQQDTSQDLKSNLANLLQYPDPATTSPSRCCPQTKARDLTAGSVTAG
jgi:hypothetical protein